MSNMVIMGAQWGDEGKGKLVDLLSREADVIVRFQGGNNAGHTVIVGQEKYILHLLPSGVLHPGKRCLIGNGVVLDPTVFCKEVDDLSARGVASGPETIMISRKTHLIMPYHKALDAARESFRSKSEKIGTTGRGIGPCYEDKMARVGLRAGDLADLELCRRKVELALHEKNGLLALYGQPTMTLEGVMDELAALASRLLPYLGDVSAELKDARERGLKVLFEGAQGTLLDIDHGTYPFVTSSNTVAGSAAAGSGCPPSWLDRILAIVKAYTTRVGSGPFPTELSDACGEHLQGQGAEFGATTGRRRRCGWLDLVALREAVRLSGPTEIAMTKLDVLGGLEELKLCVAYELDGERLDYPPQQQGAMERCQPIYESMPGWSEDVSGVTAWDQLPAAARDYVLAVEQRLGVPVSLVSVGPDREQTLKR